MTYFAGKVVGYCNVCRAPVLEPWPEASTIQQMCQCRPCFPLMLATERDDAAPQPPEKAPK